MLRIPPSVQYLFQPPTWGLSGWGNPAFLMTLFTGKALDWVTAVWDSDTYIRTAFTYYTQQISEVFEYPAGSRDISVQLMQLHQETDTTTDYTTKFHTLAVQSRWREHSGQIYPLSVPETQAMESLIEKAVNTSYIQPCTSPLAAEFFFMKKKNRGLRTLNTGISTPSSCNTLTPWFWYVFLTKLDSSSAYNIISIK